MRHARVVRPFLRALSTPTRTARAAPRPLSTGPSPLGPLSGAAAAKAAPKLRSSAEKEAAAWAEGLGREAAAAGPAAPLTIMQKLEAAVDRPLSAMSTAIAGSRLGRDGMPSHIYNFGMLMSISAWLTSETCYACCCC